MMTHRVLIATALLMSGAAAHADYVSGNSLFQNCTSRDATKQIDCLNQIFGAASGIRIVSDVWELSVLCVPDGVEASQMRDIVVRWLQRHPEKRHYTIGAVTLSALREAWPCKAARVPQ